MAEWHGPAGRDIDQERAGPGRATPDPAPATGEPPATGPSTAAATSPVGTLSTTSADAASADAPAEPRPVDASSAPPPPLPPPPPATSTDARGPVRPVVAWVALLIVVAVAALASWAAGPPAARSAAAPPDLFSAERAAADLDALATGPAVTGSPAGDAVRDRLVARLAELGLAPQVQRGTGISVKGQTASAGRAENVVATLRGTAPGAGRVVVVAHYDTAPGSPGAADDRASVAAVLEIARALTAGPPPRADVVFLLTDGEESGQLGAALFGRLQPGPGVVVNGEGEGNAGPSMLVQLTPGARPVVAAFAGADHSAGHSVTPALFPLLPDATDLDALGAAGYAGLTLSPMDGRAYHQSPLDTPDRLDRGTLQQHGDTMLSLVRGFADGDAAVPERYGATFVTLFGLVLHYPDGALVPLVLLSFAIVVVYAMLARRQRGAVGPRLVAGSVLALLGLIVAGALGTGLVQLLVTVQPGYAAMPSVEPYRPGFLRAAVAVLAAFVVLTWAGLLRRRVGRPGVAFGTVLWLAVAGAVLSGIAPGTAFVATLPAITAGLGAIAALLVGDERPRVQLLVSLAGALLAALLLLLQGSAVLLGGLPGATLAAVLYAAAGLLLLPVVAAAVGRRTRLVPVLALVVTAALVAAGVAADPFGPAYPRPTALAYVADAGGGAWWVTSDPTPPDWTRHYTPQAGPVATPLPTGVGHWRGPAPATGVPAPEVTAIGTRDAPGGTVVTLRVRSLRGAGTITVQAARPAVDVGVTMDGDGPVRSRVGPGTPLEDPRFPFRLQLTDVPATGATVELTVAGPGPLQLAVSDSTPGLDAVPGFAPRPAELTRGRADSDVVIASRLVVVGY
ncbi:M28 family peptidase [Pseudonocardia sp. CA-107938]|uniref:M28 family peptidase n=1 Tax=Pseudonocardia sp. CA-107938 TaxID=3240021 RepID=UPI003D9114CE